MQEIQLQAITRTNAARRAEQRRKQASKEVLPATSVTFSSSEIITDYQPTQPEAEDIQPFDELDAQA